MTDSRSPWRDDDETTTAAPAATSSARRRCCPLVCAASFVATRRQTYCTSACKQVAWRRRRSTPQVPPLPPARRDTTVYVCGECDTRELGHQWCHDCNRPRRRLGTGGECLHCGEFLTVKELLGGAPMA